MNKNQIFRETLTQGVNFTYIPDQKFKTTLISFSMFTPLSEREVSGNAVLPGLLSHSCKKYPRLQDISSRLEELYGASVSGSVSKLGETQVVTLYAVGLNNFFAHESQNNISDLNQLLCEMIFNPDVESDSFKDKNLNQEKRQLIEDIEAEINDKKTYARRRCQEIMCANEKFSINVNGDIQTARKLTGQDVYKAWKKLLSSSHVEIIVIGNADHMSIASEFKSRFSDIKRENVVVCGTQIIEKAEETKEVEENLDITQCKLVMGFRTATSYPSKDNTAFLVMNALLGGTAQSKLFLNVREKLSLCYYCSSKYNKHKAVMFIESGVEKEKVDQAKKEIMEQLKEVKIGNFTDTELEETKLFIIQAVKSTNDSLSGLNSWYLSQTLSNKIKSPENLIEEISEVSREKVIEMANRVTLDTIYLLAPKHKKEEV